MAETENTNVAKRHARVGAQIGSVGRDVHVGAGPITGIRADVTDLRQAMLAALGAGELDPARFVAAEKQFEEIDKHLDDAGSGHRRRLLEALARLKELVVNAADLGAKVAAIINAVHGMP